MAVGLALILRSLITRGVGAAAAKPAGSSLAGLGGAAGRKGGEEVAKKTFGESIKQSLGIGTIESAQRRTAIAGARDAAKPKVDFGRMIGDMGNKNARRDELARVADEELRQKDELNKSLGAEIQERGRMVHSVKRVSKVFGISAAMVTGWFLGTKKMTDSMEESNRRFAAFNGAIAASQAKLDVQRFQLNMKTARENAGTVKDQNAAIGDFREAFQPIERDLRTITNAVGTANVKLATFMALAIGAMKEFSILTPILKRLERRQAAKDAEGVLVQQELIKQFKNNPNQIAPRPPLPQI